MEARIRRREKRPKKEEKCDLCDGECTCNLNKIQRIRAKDLVKWNEAAWMKVVDAEDNYGFECYGRQSGLQRLASFKAGQGVKTTWPAPPQRIDPKNRKPYPKKKPVESDDVSAILERRETREAQRREEAEQEGQEWVPAHVALQEAREALIEKTQRNVGPQLIWDLEYLRTIAEKKRRDVIRKRQNLDAQRQSYCSILAEDVTLAQDVEEYDPVIMVQHHPGGEDYVVVEMPVEEVAMVQQLPEVIVVAEVEDQRLEVEDVAVRVVRARRRTQKVPAPTLRRSARLAAKKAVETARKAANQVARKLRR